MACTPALSIWHLDSDSTVHSSSHEKSCPFQLDWQVANRRHEDSKSILTCPRVLGWSPMKFPVNEELFHHRAALRMDCKSEIAWLSTEGQDRVTFVTVPRCSVIERALIDFLIIFSMISALGTKIAHFEPWLPKYAHFFWPPMSSSWISAMFKWINPFPQNAFPSIMNELAYFSRILRRLKK